MNNYSVTCAGVVYTWHNLQKALAFARRVTRQNGGELRVYQIHGEHSECLYFVANGRAHR